MNSYFETNIINDRSPDVEVIFEFNGTKTTPIHDGYRPSHLICSYYLTTGVHHYYDAVVIPPNGMVKGTITFLTPEVYPHCLSIGQRVSIQEGSRVVGFATIVQIFNSILCIEDN